MWRGDAAGHRTLLLPSVLCVPGRRQVTSKYYLLETRRGRGKVGGVSFICSCPEERHPLPLPPPRLASSPPPGRQRDEGQMGATESALVGSCPPALSTERCSRAELRTSLGGADTSSLLAHAPRSGPPPCRHAVVSTGTELRSTSLSSRRGEHGHRAQVHLLVSRHAVVSTSTELMSTSLSSRRGEHRAQVHILVVTQW